MYLNRGMRLQMMLAISVQSLFYRMGFRLVKMFVNYENYQMRLSVMAFRPTGSFSVGTGPEALEQKVSHNLFYRIPIDFPSTKRMLGNKRFDTFIENLATMPAAENESNSLTAI